VVPLSDALKRRLRVGGGAPVLVSGAWATRLVGVEEVGEYSVVGWPVDGGAVRHRRLECHACGAPFEVHIVSVYISVMEPAQHHQIR
jgi:hypothetical protein